jgi:hypothetical protein
VSFSFVGMDVHHKLSISNNFSFGHCLTRDKKYCVRSFNSSPNTLGQPSELICCCFVPDRKSSFILYEVALLQAGAIVLIDDSICHGNMSIDMYGGYSNTLVIFECNGMENPWGKKLGLSIRVLVCPGSSVVPGEGGMFHMFFFKIVK